MLYIVLLLCSKTDIKSLFSSLFIQNLLSRVRHHHFEHTVSMTNKDLVASCCYDNQ